MENQIIIIKKTLRGKHLANMSTPVQQGKVQSQLHGVSKHRYQRQKGQCTTRQPSWQWNFGPQNYRTNGNYQQGINTLHN